MKDKDMHVLIVIRHAPDCDCHEKSDIRSRSANQAYRDNYDAIFGDRKDPRVDKTLN